MEIEELFNAALFFVKNNGAVEMLGGKSGGVPVDLQLKFYGFAGSRRIA
jgi:hypothetical protein